MRNVSIRIAGCFLVLATLLWSLSCSGTPEPGNNQAQNQNVTPANGNMNVRFTSDACKSDDGSTLEQRRDRVRTDIERQIKNNDDLRKQLEGADGESPRFDFEVVAVKDPNSSQGYLEVVLRGRLDGEDELEELSEVLNNFKKDYCVLRVRWVPKSETPSNSNARSAGFDWSLCEWPKQVCDNGQCLKSCDRLSNTNTTVNANVNVNVNVSGNVNRRENSNNSTRN